MLKSVRFWFAVILLLAVVCCSVHKHRSRRTIQQKPVVSKSTTAESLPSAEETQPFTETFLPENSGITEETPLLTEPETEQESAVQLEFHADEPYISESKCAEIAEKLTFLSENYPDVIGWIYMADSDIDYPIAQGTDNQYYLHHAPDGRENQLGTIFLDYRCTREFSDRQNILFGHNMQSGMFGDIRSFKDEAEFVKHQYGWLFTLDAVYRIDFFALVIASAYDNVYDVPQNQNQWLQRLLEQAMYQREIEIAEGDKIIALSTCASDFEDARALFTGKLLLYR